MKQIQAASSSVSLLCHGHRSTFLNPSRNGTSIQANGLYSRGAVWQLWLWGLNEMIILDDEILFIMCVAQITCVLCIIFFIRTYSVCLRMYTVVNYFWHATCERREIQPNAPTTSKQKRQTNAPTMSLKGLRQPARDTQQE